MKSFPYGRTFILGSGFFGISGIWPWTRRVERCLNHDNEGGIEIGINEDQDRSDRKFSPLVFTYEPLPVKKKHP
jgi:hypothetical protein